MGRNELQAKIEDLYYAENGHQFTGDHQDLLAAGFDLITEYKSELLDRAEAGAFGVDGTIESLRRVSELNKIVLAILDEQDALAAA